MPYPIAHGLIGASIFAATRSNLSFNRDWKKLLIAALIAICPDFDLFFAEVLKLGDDWHRSFSHSIIFAFALGLLVSVLADKARPKEVLAFGLAAVSHGLFDMLTKSHLGVELLWPFSVHRFNLGLIDYPVFTFSWELPSIQGLITASSLLQVSLIELATFTPLFLIVLVTKWSINNLVNSRRIQD